MLFPVLGKKLKADRKQLTKLQLDCNSTNEQLSCAKRRNGKSRSSLTKRGKRDNLESKKVKESPSGTGYKRAPFHVATELMFRCW